MDKLILSNYSTLVEFNGVTNIRSYNCNMISITFEDESFADRAYDEFKREFPVERFFYGSSLTNNKLLITNCKDELEISVS